MSTPFLASRHPDLVPKGEIWIERGVEPKERGKILLHELAERALMKRGKGYHQAHRAALKAEGRGRHDPYAYLLGDEDEDEDDEEEEGDRTERRDRLILRLIGRGYAPGLRASRRPAASLRSEDPTPPPRRIPLSLRVSDQPTPPIDTTASPTVAESVGGSQDPLRSLSPMFLVTLSRRLPRRLPRFGR
jgi:hypothetical protein